jgi:hypothetical protein
VVRHVPAADRQGTSSRHGKIDIAAKAPNLTILERTVNGQPGLAAQQDGVTVVGFAFDVAGDLIKHIWAVRNLRTSGLGRRAEAR